MGMEPKRGWRSLGIRWKVKSVVRIGRRGDTTVEIEHYDLASSIRRTAELLTI